MTAAQTQVVGRQRVIAAVLFELRVVEMVAFQFAINRRTMPAEQSGDLIDGQFLFAIPIQFATLIQIELHVEARHAFFSKANTLILLTCRTSK
jgi:hypothetical protein